MRKLKSCAVVVQNEEDVTYYERFYRSADQPEEQLITTVDHGQFRVVTLSQMDSHTLRTDLLIIEDRWEPAARLACSAVHCESINNIVIVHKVSVMKRLLDSKLPEPSTITLDFNLEEMESSTHWAKTTSELYSELKQHWPQSYVIGISGYYITEDAAPVPESADLVELIRSNGDDVFAKTPELDRFVHHLYRNAISTHNLRIEAKVAEERAKSSEMLARVEAMGRQICGAPTLDRCPLESPVGYIVGRSSAMRYVYWAIERYANSDTPVHIYGETGTGKELVAKAIHERSDRSTQPYVTIASPNVPSELFESELFGHKKGAFTGAISNQTGKLKLADRGSILLDEIGNLPYSMQPKLLRFLETQRFTPLGAKLKDAEEVDVRVVSTANQDLNDGVTDGTFREDLIYRLGADFPIRLPPLREHSEDIPALFEFFLNQQCQKTKRSLPPVEKHAYTFLQSFNWPGNVRQLVRTVERILLTTDASQAISASIAEACIPPEPLAKRTAAISDHLFELRRSNAKVEDYLNALEAAYLKAEGKSVDGKPPSLEAIGSYCNPPKSHSAISQFFTRNEDVIRQFSSLSTRWSPLRRLNQWPR